MVCCDVLIVGGGPAGSSCAWKLRNSGLTTVILDKQIFPRDKVCGGWITLPVLQELEIDAGEYRRGRVFQAIHGFRVSRLGGREVETDYGKPISYGIRRCEFDEFLLQRCGAQIHQGVPLASLERSDDQWVVNGKLKARLVVGAGGHFCPVARWRGVNARQETPIAAQEVEFEMTAHQLARCSIRAEIPELYFCPDMKGYGWCFRKSDYLNVGLGRLDPHEFPKQVAGFREFLKSTGKIAFDLPASFPGHSYLLRSCSRRDAGGEGILLIGDAAGLAYPQSGEGIRPAIESGLLAARAILSADGLDSPKLAENYRRLLSQRFESSADELTYRLGRRLPGWLLSSLARFLFASRWFSRRVILDGWFLRCQEPGLSC